MPHTTKWERRGVTWIFWGVVSGEELLEANQEIYGDARFDGMRFQIVDMTAVERFDVSLDDMTVLAATDKAASKSNPDVRVAVAARDELIRQLSLYYEREADGSPWRQQIFESVEAARNWVAV